MSSKQFLKEIKRLIYTKHFYKKYESCNNLFINIFYKLNLLESKKIEKFKKYISNIIDIITETCNYELYIYYII